MSILDFREPVSAWTHLLWMLLTIPATWLLWHRSRGDRPKQLSMLVFGLSLIACFAASGTWHAVRLSPAGLDFFKRLDYAGIYLLIVGTSTPIIFTLLRGPWRRGTLVIGWSLAAFGIAAQILHLDGGPWLTTGMYLGLGWGLGSCFPQLLRVMPGRILRPIPIGGALYSVGALIFIFRWPNFWPGVFGSHEVFHLFVMAGSAAHYWFILTRVAPYPRRAPRRDELAPALAPG
jgi:hemolysin III